MVLSSQRIPHFIQEEGISHVQETRALSPCHPVHALFDRRDGRRKMEQPGQDHSFDLPERERRHLPAQGPGDECL